MRWLFAASLACVLAGAAPAARTALPRATADRPDDVLGPQVHVIYALPSDGTDRSLDTNGAIGNSVASFQRWLAAETGGRRLRLDTFQASLDVTFVRLPRTDAEMASRGAFIRGEIERLLQSAGFAVADRVYAVYYDGSTTSACGSGAWPPALPGTVAAEYLHGGPPGSPPCDTTSLAAPGAPPGYLDYGMLHEIFHTLGAVPTCAPHSRGPRDAHTSDRPDDIMWAGTGDWKIPGHLDPGRDDYYGHGRSDCLDLARSPFLTAAPPRLTAGRLTLSKARAGRPFSAAMPVLLGGRRPAAAVVRCETVATFALPAPRRSYARGTATCAWRLPATSRGRQLAGAIRVSTAGQSVSRSFNVGIRAAPNP
jgi:hypothetical protein